MASSLDSLSRNLVGVNGMMCNQCKSETELSHIDENYVAHGMCWKCRWATPRASPGDSHCKLMIDLIVDDPRISHMDKQF